jgi:hypothetical protein
MKETYKTIDYDWLTRPTGEPLENYYRIIKYETKSRF